MHFVFVAFAFLEDAQIPAWIFLKFVEQACPYHFLTSIIFTYEAIKLLAMGGGHVDPRVFP